MLRRRRGPAAVVLGPGDGVTDPLPGLTLVFGAPGSGKSILLTHLARALSEVQAWIPDPVIDGQWPALPSQVNLWAGWNAPHPLDDNLLRLALLCDRSPPRTLLVDVWGRGGPRTGRALAGWKSLAEDTGHRVVLVMDPDMAIARWLSPVTVAGMAHQVVVMRSQINPRLVPEPFQTLCTRPVGWRDAGEAIIYRTTRPQDAALYRVPYPAGATL